jgi:hypothetical protein
MPVEEAHNVTTLIQSPSSSIGKTKAKSAFSAPNPIHAAGARQFNY